MNAREYLNRAYRLETRINNKTEQIHRLRALAARMTAAYDGEAVSHPRALTAARFGSMTKARIFWR